MPGLEHVLTNPFLAATKISASHANSIGRFTDEALGAPGTPAEIKALYDAYHPVFENFRTLYIGRSASKGERKGATTAQTQRLAELSQRIKEWGLAIEMVYRRDNPKYLTFLPHGRKPFRRGAIIDRASAVHQLVLALQTDPAFSTLLADVQAFSEQLDAAIAQANGAEAIKSTSSNQLEKGRIELCHALYAVLGALIHLYPDHPEKATAYFDIATMHRHRHRKAGEKRTTTVVIEAETAKNEAVEPSNS